MTIEERLMLKLGEKDFQIAQLQAQLEELSKQLEGLSQNLNMESFTDSE